MKKIALLLLLISFLNLPDLQAAEKRIENRRFRIDTSSYKGIFPDSWLSKKINAHAEKLNKNEVKRSRKIINHAFQKYPDDVLKNNLGVVYVLHRLKYFGINAGGTNSTRDVYLTNRGINNGHSNRWLELAFHTEFSSILLRNHPQSLDKQAWLKINGKSFQYLGSGVKAVQNKKSNKKYDVELNKKGFLCEYSTAAFEEDFNAIAENLLLGDQAFWTTIDQHQKLKAKTDLAIAFYHQIDPKFDKAYFISLIDPEKSKMGNLPGSRVLVLHHHPEFTDHAKERQHDWGLILRQLEKANFSSISYQGGLGSGYELTIESSNVSKWKKMIDQLNKQKRLKFYRSYKRSGELISKLNQKKD